MPVKLHTVTITGADDEVDPADLVALSREYPFVEWGILWSEKSPRPRFSSFNWKLKLGELQEASTSIAVHTCGGWSRNIIRGNEASLWVKEVLPFVVRRVQLNGFSSVWWPQPESVPANRDIQWIMQVQDAAALERAEKIYDDHPNVSALWDLSGGKGVRCDFSRVPYRTPPSLPMGYAGGIGPDNIEEVISQLDRIRFDTWIDMESGVRTNNHFDLEKVRKVLEKTAPFVVEKRER